MRNREETYLDEEEKTLMESLDEEGWQSVADLGSWKKTLSLAARNTLTKDRRMNIRVSQTDFDGIRRRAVDEGIPYQTLIASILHKYLNGRLVEVRAQQT